MTKSRVSPCRVLPTVQEEQVAVPDVKDEPGGLVVILLDGDYVRGQDSRDRR